MHGDQHFFELPIYLEPEDAYYERFSQEVEDAAQRAWRETNDPRKDLDWHRKRGEGLREHRLQRYGGRWAYNQIFGFLGIYPLGDQLRGATWYTEKKVARKDIARKDIGWYGKAFELTVRETQSADEIFEELLDEIRELKKERPYNRRHLDTRPLELTGPLLDWRRIMDISTECGLHGVRVENMTDMLQGRFDRLGPRTRKGA